MEVELKKLIGQDFPLGHNLKLFVIDKKKILVLPKPTSKRKIVKNIPLN